MVVRALPGIRSNLRKHVAAQFQPGQFTVPILLSSVETSLKKLRTDYIDILFMHEASLNALHDDTLLEAMQRLQQSGKVRLIGASSEPDAVTAAAANPRLNAIQFPSHIGNGFARVATQRPTDHALLKIVNHPFGGADGSAKLRDQLATLAANTGTPQSLRTKLRSNEDGLLPDVALNLALGPDNHVVLATMMQPSHLHLNAAAVMKSRFDESERTQLRALLAAGVHASAGARLEP